MIESEPFIPSKALELEYDRELKALITPMLKEVSEEVLKAYRTDFAQDGMDDIERLIEKLKEKFDRLYREKGAEAAKKMVMKQVRFCKATFKRVMARLLPEEKANKVEKSVISKGLDAIIIASVYENVTLIKSLCDKFFEQITGSVVRSVQNGINIKQLTEEIFRYGEMTKKRARLIALDQTRKTYMAISRQNLKDAGFNKVMWRHSGGGEPRPYHIRKWDGVSGKEDGHPNGLNGFIFDLNNPPVIEHAYVPKTSKGTYRGERRGLPAELPNCKCVMVAILN